MPRAHLVNPARRGPPCSQRGSLNLEACTLSPTPLTLHPACYTIHPDPYNPTPFIWRQEPGAISPAPRQNLTLTPTPCNLPMHLKPCSVPGHNLLRFTGGVLTSAIRRRGAPWEETKSTGMVSRNAEVLHCGTAENITTVTNPSALRISIATVSNLFL